jgi:hypothetical protein
MLISYYSIRQINIKKNSINFNLQVLTIRTLFFSYDNNNDLLDLLDDFQHTELYNEGAFYIKKK